MKYFLFIYIQTSSKNSCLLSQIWSFVIDSSFLVFLLLEAWVRLKNASYRRVSSADITHEKHIVMMTSFCRWQRVFRGVIFWVENCDVIFQQWQHINCVHIFKERWMNLRWIRFRIFQWKRSKIFRIYWRTQLINWTIFLWKRAKILTISRWKPWKRSKILTISR